MGSPKPPAPPKIPKPEPPPPVATDEDLAATESENIRKGRKNKRGRALSILSRRPTATSGSTALLGLLGDQNQ